MRAAFEKARIAILRAQSGCPGGGQLADALPADKFEQWKEVEISFDPNDMRLR